jgi:hypothetical protein
LSGLYAWVLTKSLTRHRIPEHGVDRAGETHPETGKAAAGLVTANGERRQSQG